MAGIGPEETRTLARLAKLRLRDEELTEYGEQLERIIGYIESLQQVDVDGVSAFVGAAPANSALRADTVENRDGREAEELVGEILNAVPQARDRQVVVPKIKDAD